MESVELLVRPYQFNELGILLEHFENDVDCGEDIRVEMPAKEHRGLMAEDVLHQLPNKLS